jgi:hypothetical protein
MDPDPRLRLISPTGLPSSVTHSTEPSGRLTFLTWTVRRLKPPQPLSFDMSAVATPLGVWPPIADPLGGSVAVPCV